MKSITVTISTPDRTMKKMVEVPLNCSVDFFKQEAKDKFNLSMYSCILVVEDTNRVILDGETFESASIKSGELLCLYPQYEVS